MNKTRLGVNIDHVATVRNARGENYPSPLRAALLAQKNGADSITIHLREDRRHINDEDLKKIKSKLKIPLNLEIASTNEMLGMIVSYEPSKNISRALSIDWIVEHFSELISDKDHVNVYSNNLRKEQICSYHQILFEPVAEGLKVISLSSNNHKNGVIAPTSKAKVVIFNI